MVLIDNAKEIGKLDFISLNMGNTSIKPSKTAKNLRIAFHSILSFIEHAKEIINLCFNSNI